MLHGVLYIYNSNIYALHNRFVSILVICLQDLVVPLILDDAVISSWLGVYCLDLYVQMGWKACLQTPAVL